MGNQEERERNFYNQQLNQNVDEQMQHIQKLVLLVILCEIFCDSTVI